MISTHWLEKRQTHWNRLEQLLEQSGKGGLKSLTRSELQELGLLYRQAAADLSALREDPSGKYYAHSINLLLSRAHNTIYSGQKASAKGILHFYRFTYPQIFRHNLKLILTSFLLFVAGGLLGMLLSATRPDFVRTFLPPQMTETIERHQMWTDPVIRVSPRVSSAIMTNNLTVSFIAFAYGLTFGIGTAYMLFSNGVLIGVVGTACWYAGMGLPLWSFIAPHGILELPAIFIAGAAGFRLAQAILFPGVLTRRDSLIHSGGDAVRLLMGVVPVLIIAGLIEGFISPSQAVHWPWKFALSASIGVIFFSYLFYSARGGAAAAGSQSLHRCK